MRASQYRHIGLSVKNHIGATLMLTHTNFFMATTNYMAVFQDPPQLC